MFLPSLFGRELLFWDSWCRFLCKYFLGSDFCSKIFGKYFLFRVFVWKNLWDHSKISSGIFGANVDETQSKYAYWKNQEMSGIFGTQYFWIMHAFWCCGNFDSYCWVRYLPKVFWIFLGIFPTRFLEIICGRSLQGRPRKYIPEHLFKNCLWRNFQQIFFNFFVIFGGDY